ncbi:hypothetical protein [Bradyrhizobium sp. HKCCYLRH2015]|uniref:hypothetical protein n=1 Tax=Bradyrhizobium sp. HKCCYLRH2015 TaxID=3420742 RepID=UPI003EC079E7
MGMQDDILPPGKVGRTDAVEIAGVDFDGRDPLPACDDRSADAETPMVPHRTRR